VKTSGSASKPTGGKAAESNMKPSEMLLDLNDDCECVTSVALSWIIDIIIITVYESFAVGYV